MAESTSRSWLREILIGVVVAVVSAVIVARLGLDRPSEAAPGGKDRVVQPAGTGLESPKPVRPVRSVAPAPAAPSCSRTVSACGSQGR